MIVTLLLAVVYSSDYNRQSLLARYGADILHPRDIHMVRERESYSPCYISS